MTGLHWKKDEREGCNHPKNRICLGSYPEIWRWWESGLLWGGLGCVLVTS